MAMMVKGLKPLLCEEKLEKSGTVQPRKEKTRGDLMNMYKYLKGGCTEGGARLFQAVPTSDMKMGTTETQEAPPEYKEILFE